MFLDIKLTHRAFTILDEPAANALIVEIMEAHQKSLLFILFDIALTNNAVACLASML